MRKNLHTSAATFFLTSAFTFLSEILVVFFVPLFFCSLSAGFASCSTDVIFAGDTEAVCFKLPSWPPENASSYPELAYWKITEVSENVIKTFTISPETRKIALTCDKNTPFSLSAEPVNFLQDGSKTQFFKPAAAIYPFDFDDGNCCLQWKNGFRSQIFFQLVNNAKQSGKSAESIINSFNWEKFQETIDKKLNQSIQDFSQSDASSAKFYNPWQLNSQDILQSISIAQFDSTLLNTTWIYSFTISDIFSDSEPSEIFSQFIPENQILQKYKTLILKKNQEQYFYTPEEILITLTATSSKKVSQAYASLPILIEEL